MVGLSDIPCVGKFVERVSDATVDAFFRGLHYLFCYKQLVNVLDSEIDKVNIQEDRVSTKSVQERNDGKIIKDPVLRWQAEVDEFQQGAKEFSGKFSNRASWTCLKCLPIPKPVSRFRLGRDAVLKTKRATELVHSGKELLANEIAHFPPVENLPRNDADFLDFLSRKDVYGKLWEAVITEASSLILGIYGMPGVGKTRMMEQLWKEAKEKNIFDKVARADVGSQGVDVIKLQNQIASHLDCHFQSQDNVESRASQLKNSLMNGGKILIILDDVWSEIPLDHIIGTSFGQSSSSKGSKILLTSRREDVCLCNKCDCPFQLTTLRDEEAWDLFRSTVGTSRIDSLQDEKLAKKVCSKCAGLPLLIRAVGKALQFMSHNVWKDALQKLEKGNFKNIDGIDPQVYACVKLSIDRLSEDAKSCLFLCSLFPEDANIHIMKLIQFAIGSQFIPDGESTVLAMVDILLISSLLLQGTYDGVHITYKLHDIIRDVARYISSIDPKYAFSHAKCGSRFPGNVRYSSSKLLRLDVESDYAQFPEDLVCTDLSTLWLHCNSHLEQFSGNFFNMFVNLGFLMLQNVHFCSEHFSLERLGKLKTLIFDDCDIKETDASLFPKNLSTLCIQGCKLPSPLDLPKLEYLQKLEIQKESGEVIMVPNVISSLSSLEELHIPNGFRYSDNGKDRTRMLDEICKLSRLTSLKIYLWNFEPSQGACIFFRLLKYQISVGKQWNNQNLSDSPRVIELFYVELERYEALQSLIKRAEEVRLEGTDVDVCSIWNSDRDRAAFTELRKLRIESSDSGEYIARISQDEIQHSRQPQTSFSKLTYIDIQSCPAMKYLFCKSVAKCLVQLQELRVYYCGAMEVIVMNQGTSDGEIINFPKLKTLRLRSLGSLRSFYREKKEKSDMSSSYAQQEQVAALFDGMVAFPCLEVLKLEGLKISEIWGKKQLQDYYDDNNNNMVSSSTSSSFCKLKRLEVNECNKVESCLIPHAMLHRIQNLEYLYIRECNRLRNAFPPIHLIHIRLMQITCCEMMREIIGGGTVQQQRQGQDDDITAAAHNNNLEEDVSGEENAGMDAKTIIRLLQLESVFFTRLPNLKSFIHGANYECYMPSLKEVEVYSCGLSSLFTCSVFRNLQQLERLEVSNCRFLQDIVKDGMGVETSDPNDKAIIHSQLSSVTLDHLPNLKSFSPTVNCAFNMPNLKEFHLLGCPRLENFTCLRTTTGLVSVYTEELKQEAVTDLNDFIIQNHNRRK